jgi:hypothetical protein
MRKNGITWAAAGALLACTVPATAADAPPLIHRPRAAPALIGPVTTLPPAQFDEKLKVGGDDVKARELFNRLTVETMVNGRGPFHFIVDSGADTSVVGLGIARDLQLPLGTPIVLNNMTSRNIVDRVKVDHLSFGPSSISDIQIPALSEGDLGSQGMLGIDALVEQRLMLDFDKKLIKVEDARTKAEIIPGAIVITARRQRGQLILTHVYAGGVALDAVIDTGSEVTVGNTALRDRLIRKGHGDFVTAEVIGVTGVVQKVQMAKIPELRLGPVVLKDVTIAFADLPPFKVFGIADEPALLLGTDLLGNFRTVSLDFLARKVRFQLRKCSEQHVVTNPNADTRLSIASLSWGGPPQDCIA